VCIISAMYLSIALALFTAIMVYAGPAGAMAIIAVMFLMEVGE